MILRPYLAAALALLVTYPACAATKKAARKAPAPKAAVKAAPAAQSAHRKSPYVGAISAAYVPYVEQLPNGKSTTKWKWVTKFSDNADAEAYPASVTKLMTALLVLEDVAAGKYKLTDSATATPDVSRCEASWVGIKAGQSMTVDDLLMALMVNSANDAAIVLGVHSAGSLAGFVARMNARAAELGMANTRYFNPNGLPAPRYGKAFNRSTAADQLKLACVVVQHPEIFKYTSAKTATVTGGNGKPIWMKNHNRILRMDKYHIHNPDGTEAVDGLKTGYIDAGGSSIVLTGKRNGRRAIVVVLGSASADIREEHAGRLMSDALGAAAW